ncbi:MAG: hypothetical protein GPJ54_11740 [Candidatus Heimdallarchaeota archaeon]|nr:hypothetical protein [Candidatus Heimdallarchaeota archaeon]
MVVWTITETINLIVAILSIIPSIILVRQYRRTQIFDYLIFSGAFITVSFTLVWTILATLTELLIFYQLHHITYFFTSYFFAWHALRLRWERPPRLIWYIVNIWIIIAIIIVLLFKIMIQPESAEVIFIQMHHGYSSYYPKGAGVTINGDVILYSTSHNIIRVFYSLFAFFIMLYAYLTVDLAHKTSAIVRGRKLWLIAIINSLLYFTAILPWVLIHIHFDVQIILSLGLILVAYVNLKIPEAMLMSHVQLTRASFLYHKVRKMTEVEAQKQLGMESLVRYLQSLPQHLLVREG